MPNTRKPRNIPEYKILEVYKSTRVITIVLRFTRNKLIIGRQAKVVVIVNKNQIYRTLLWRFHKGRPNSKGGLGSGATCHSACARGPHTYASVLWLALSVLLDGATARRFESKITLRVISCGQFFESGCQS